MEMREKSQILKKRAPNTCSIFLKCTLWDKKIQEFIFYVEKHLWMRRLHSFTVKCHGGLSHSDFSKAAVITAESITPPVHLGSLLLNSLQLVACLPDERSLCSIHVCHINKDTLKYLMAECRCRRTGCGDKLAQTSCFLALRPSWLKSTANIRRYRINEPINQLHRLFFKCQVLIVHTRNHTFYPSQQLDKCNVYIVFIK